MSAEFSKPLLSYPTFAQLRAELGTCVSSHPESEHHQLQFLLLQLSAYFLIPRSPFFLFLWLENYFLFFLFGVLATCIAAVMHDLGCLWSNQGPLFLFLWPERQSFSLKFVHNARPMLLLFKVQR